MGDRKFFHRFLKKLGGFFDFSSKSWLFWCYSKYWFFFFSEIFFAFSILIFFSCSSIDQKFTFLSEKLVRSSYFRFLFELGQIFDFVMIWSWFFHDSLKNPLYVEFRFLIEGKVDQISTKLNQTFRKWSVHTSKHIWTSKVELCIQWENFVVRNFYNGR